MDTLWVVVGAILMLAGVAGSILPFLPGPPLCFIGLLIQQLREPSPFTAKFLWIWVVINVVLIVFDYVVPIYGTKKYGGSKAGVWGCTIGLIAGLFFGPIGIVLGPFAGALIGELMASGDSQLAVRAAFGSFIGFLLGTLLKIVACGFMIYYFVQAI